MDFNIILRDQIQYFVTYLLNIGGGVKHNSPIFGHVSHMTIKDKVKKMKHLYIINFKDEESRADG